MKAVPESIKEGQRVTLKAEVTGRYVNQPNPELVMICTDDNNYFWVPLDSVQSINGTKSPASWPPQLGDVWRKSSGMLVFATRDDSYPGRLVWRNTDGRLTGFISTEYVKRADMDQEYTLEYRRPAEPRRTANHHLGGETTHSEFIGHSGYKQHKHLPNGITEWREH